MKRKRKAYMFHPLPLCIGEKMLYLEIEEAVKKYRLLLEKNIQWLHDRPVHSEGKGLLEQAWKEHEQGKTLKFDSAKDAQKWMDSL